MQQKNAKKVLGGVLLGKNKKKVWTWKKVSGHNFKSLS